MTALLFYGLGAAWRVWDGWGEMWPGGVRVAIGALIALAATAFNLWPTDPFMWAVTIITAAGPVWALVRGFDDWTSWKTVYHYWPAVTGVVTALMYLHDPLGAAFYLASILLAGATYPLMAWIDTKYHFPYTRYAEAISGGLLIGGLAVL